MTTRPLEPIGGRGCQVAALVVGLLFTLWTFAFAALVAWQVANESAPTTSAPVATSQAGSDPAHRTE